MNRKREESWLPKGTLRGQARRDREWGMSPTGVVLLLQKNQEDRRETGLHALIWLGNGISVGRTLTALSANHPFDSGSKENLL